MKILKVKFPTEVLKRGKAIKVTCKKFNFESDCIVTQISQFKLTIVYFNKKTKKMCESVLTIKDAIDNEYYIEILN
ncbi:hypothetical protein IC218_04470 [Clostridioides sp. ES-S-0005-03]|uniref:hypothetical protein n=1 Tax=unclassified Clostridioides TaxID=2635829 RepID=UPI001D0C1AC9|nr:hypothetical protein [Clostridioides sp. ES-S-0005-03]MCC0765061.1 hypothetical protein [Clostridioides sp. ES-S-0006-03]